MPGVLEHLRSPGHTLLIMTTGEQDAGAAHAAVAQVSGFDGLVHPVVVQNERRRELLLARPDGHLACRARIDRPDIPERYLHELTRGPANRPRASTTQT